MTLFRTNLWVYLRHGAFLSGTILISLTWGTNRAIPSASAEETSQPANTQATDAAGDATAPEVRALTFKGVEAGTTTLADLKEAWGAPASTLHDEGLTIHVYD